MATTTTALRFALRHAWQSLRSDCLTSLGKRNVTATEARSFLKARLDNASNPGSNLVRFWYPLGVAEKDAALAEALPDGQYGEEEEVRWVIERLTEYQLKFDEILKLIGDKRSFKPAEKQILQQLLKDLKTELENDTKDESRREKEMNTTERHFFYPAVRQAHGNIRVRWNSDPIKSNWGSELYSARVDISHMLSQLTKPKKKGK